MAKKVIEGVPVARLNSKAAVEVAKGWRNRVARGDGRQVILHNRQQAMVVGKPGLIARLVAIQKDRYYPATIQMKGRTFIRAI